MTRLELVAERQRIWGRLDSLSLSYRGSFMGFKDYQGSLEEELLDVNRGILDIDFLNCLVCGEHRCNGIHVLEPDMEDQVWR